MRPPQGTLEQRSTAYRLAIKHFQKKAQECALRAEQLSLAEERDALTTEWAGVSSHQRSDEYHERRRSIDNQLALLETEIFHLKIDGRELAEISEHCGLDPTFLHNKIWNLQKKKVT